MNHRTRNRSPFGLAIAAPAVVKAVCGAILAVLAVVVWQQFSELAKQQELLAPWEKVQGYGVFYPRLTGNDQQEMETGGNASSVAEARDLYPVLDQAGALFVDAANYAPDTPPDPTGRWPVPPIRVNTHYLAQYPILDAARKPITVAANDPAWVVAVPEQFKPREAQIRELLQETRTGGPGITGAVQAEQRITGDRPRFSTQQVRIVWTASGQGVFSYDPQVNPGHGNLITDPIVEIMTPANSLTVDRLNAITGGLDTGLKVRVGDDPAATLAALGPKLKELKLDDNLRHLVTVHQAMATQIDEVRGGITQVTVFAGVALFVLVALTAAIVIVGSDRLRRRLTVRRLHGIGFTRSYRELLLALGGTWLGQTVLAGIALAVLAMNTLSPPGAEASPWDRIPELAAVSVLSLAIEVLFVVVTARIVERRNTVKRLKEL
ncbi:hypothetical protein [Amycolatopsis silviterrae]|uniref:ABC transporter permease n=1 Tax=Amycolatopsis silviterrae TaxID=1656914 RepID=A0ABW5HAI2_9PSEU